jgi:hypothetical protein
MHTVNLEIDLRRKLENLLNRWRHEGLPSRSELQSLLREIADWKARTGQRGLWSRSPLMLTATLDDGWGHGLELIEACAGVAGVETQRLGLLLAPERIIAECRERQPHLLGLTVLQFDSEEALAVIHQGLPSQTRLLAGGPVFRIDPDFASRAGVHFVARNIADFLEYLLAYQNETPG